MTECFCGCGREISGWGEGGMNKNGARTRDLLAKLESARGAAGADNSEAVDLLIEGGEAFEKFWADAAHGEMQADPAAANSAHKEWRVWGRLATTTCRDLGVPVRRQWWRVG
jgi:hypothetical protein